MLSDDGCVWKNASDKPVKFSLFNATETLLAAKDAERDRDTGALIAETADLWFHSLVMLSHLGENADAVLAELARRFGISGLEEKAGRNQ